MTMTGFGRFEVCCQVLRGVEPRHLVEVNVANPLFHLAVSGTRLLVAVCASWLPARRATRIDPVRALRME